MLLLSWSTWPTSSKWPLVSVAMSVVWLIRNLFSSFGHSCVVICHSLTFICVYLSPDYKDKIGLKCQFLIEPKPKEPCRHQYDYGEGSFTRISRPGPQLYTKVLYFTGFLPQMLWVLLDSLSIMVLRITSSWTLSPTTPPWQDTPTNTMSSWPQRETLELLTDVLLSLMSKSSLTLTVEMT